VIGASRLPPRSLTRGQRFAVRATAATSVSLADLSHAPFAGRQRRTHTLPPPSILGLREARAMPCEALASPDECVEIERAALARRAMRGSQ
jgi:hypothetical protein